MSVNIRRFTAVMAAILVALLCMLVITTADSYAAKDLELEKTDIDFDVDMDPDNGCVGIGTKDGCTERILTVESVDTDIVYAEFSNVLQDVVWIYAMGTGETTVNVTGTEGTVIPVSVEVSDDALQKSQDFFASAMRPLYGHKKLRVSSIPGTRVTVKIGKDKYKATIPKKNDCRNQTYVKIKKVYNINTKVTVIFQKERSKATRAFKIETNASFREASGSKKKFTIECYDIHQGDKVRLTIGGKTYTKKIKKNYDNKACEVAFKTKKTIKPDAEFKVVIKNKYKKTLATLKAHLTYGYYEPEEDESDKD